MNKMKAMLSKKRLGWTWFLIVLSFAVILAGLALCWYAANEVNAAVEAESAKILHEPVQYISGVRDAIKDVTFVLAMGVSVMIFGSIVLSVSISRWSILRNEEKRIAKLEAKIKKLEQSSKS